MYFGWNKSKLNSGILGYKNVSQAHLSLFLSAHILAFDLSFETNLRRRDSSPDQRKETERVEEVTARDEATPQSMKKAVGQGKLIALQLTRFFLGPIQQT